jgi:autotransporter-associated beta strand protein
LQVGAGGTSGTLGTGNVTNNTALVFSRSDSLTVNNLITGSGALTQNGGGILTLTGANTYSGGTTVNVGTLGLGVDNALGTGLVTMDGGGLASSGGARALTNVVNLASGGTFDTAAGNLTLSGVVTNSGNLVKSGANTLILSGANSYSGATVIGAGTLQVGTGGTSGALGTGNVTNNAALVFNRSDNLTIANTITGTGVLTQGGAGTLVLSGANGYGGGTVVKSGTLQIGSDGSLGSAAGAVTLTNGASLQITADVSMARALAVDAGGGQLAIGANTLSNSGALSGSGALTLSGTGILALAGDGSGYSGAVTNLNGATLQLDSANALGSAGLVLGASTTVTNAAATTIGGAITGGSGIVFVKNGAGNLTLAGNSGASFLGNTTVSGGTLGVTGSLGGSAVVVSTGARLEGTGTVGTLANHGTVQPGDAGTIGTLTVNGVYTNASDGTLAIKLGNTGLCDRLVVGGAAVLGGALDLTTTGGYVAKAGDTFTNLVTATGGVSGTFSTSTITPTLEFTISYNPNDVGVRLGAAVTRNYINPGLGLNGGQMELGQALQELSGVTSGDLNAVLNAVDQLGTADSVRQAFNEILPLKMTAMGAMASQGTAVQVGNLLTHLANPLVAGGFASMGKGQNGRKPIQLAFNSPDLQGLLSPDTRKKPSPKWNFFLNGSGTIADQETTVTSPGFNFTSEGTIMGLDYWISEEWMVGGCTGYSQTQADLAGSGGQVTVGTIPVWTFGSWRKQGWYVNGGGGYTCNLYDNERNIRFPGIERTAKSEPSGSQVNGFLEGGHDFKLGSWTVGPVASLQYSKLWIDSFTESGADALNLSVSSQSAESLQSGLGGRVSYEAKVGAVKVVPQIEASWQKEYRNGRRGIEARLAQGSSPFSVQTDEPDRNFGTLTGRLALEFTPEMNVNLSCQTDVGRQNFSIYTFSGTFSLLF